MLSRKELRLVPSRPGVYILKGSQTEPMYVGKATNISDRIMAHLRPNPDDPRAVALAGKISSVDYIVTENPIEALILENTLIKRHKPRYNIRLKDDKSYPYIKITVSELYPKVSVTRKVFDDGNRYFGPYGDVGAARRSVKFLRRIFPICDCKIKLDGKGKLKACLDYHIGLCSGPCIRAIKPDAYRNLVDEFILFLEGRLQQLVTKLRQDMMHASERLEYERAAKIRDQVRALEATAFRQGVSSIEVRDKDVVTLFRKNDRVSALVFFVRGGKLVGKDRFALESEVSDDDSQVLEAFVKQYYHSATSIPREIVTSKKLKDVKVLQDWLMQKVGSKVLFFSGSRGENKELLRLAQANAKVLEEQAFAEEVAKRRVLLQGMKLLKEKLRLYKLPRKIEAFDISNIHGEQAVGSMVVFRDGKPSNNDYRRYKIATVQGIDDYSMMREVVSRRYSRASKERDPPDLVVIDGGPGHLRAAVEAMRGIGVFGIPTVGLAKKEEKIFAPNRSDPIVLPRDSKALHILQHIRDEAHRFAVSYHRRLRGKALLNQVKNSEIEQIL